jgi:hypothetical protein
VKYLHQHTFCCHAERVNTGGNPLRRAGGLGKFWTLTTHHTPRAVFKLIPSEESGRLRNDPDHVSALQIGLGEQQWTSCMSGLGRP